MQGKAPSVLFLSHIVWCIDHVACPEKSQSTSFLLRFKWFTTYFIGHLFSFSFRLSRLFFRKFGLFHWFGLVWFVKIVLYALLLHRFVFCHHRGHITSTAGSSSMTASPKILYWKRSTANKNQTKMSSKRYQSASASGEPQQEDAEDAKGKGLEWENRWRLRDKKGMLSITLSSFQRLLINLCLLQNDNQ